MASLSRERSRPLPFAGVEAQIATEAELVALALALGARRISGWSSGEERLANAATENVPRRLVADLRQRISAGEDPLGDDFCRLRSPEVRRESGATFTPRPIIEAMLDWAAASGNPERVIDPGTGSGRYLLAAARRFPAAHLLGVELDPVAAMLARANLAAAGLADRAEVIVYDYRSARFPPCVGPTLFIGNPPYVRHHAISSTWKSWLTTEAKLLGHSASQLAGLHVHFYLATVTQSKPGDFGAFITAAEWLDVNYGRLVRELFLGALGGSRVAVIEPKALPFPDAATTAAITCFKIGEKSPSARFQHVESVEELDLLNGARVVPRQILSSETRWSALTRKPRKTAAGLMELGELCRVHRGQVTGLNSIWIAGPHSRDLPDSVLFPCITKARELFAAGEVIKSAAALRFVVDLPFDLNEFDPMERKAIDRFLEAARLLGAHEGYVAMYRRAWWSVGLRDPAPILATYMARRPPAFVLNRASARHINIAHGLYPREPLGETVLLNLVRYLRDSVRLAEGRTYAGGLTKFEPREMERLLVPKLEILVQAKTDDRPTALVRGRT